MKKYLLIPLCLVFIGCAHFSGDFTMSMEGCVRGIAGDVSEGIADSSYVGMSVIVAAPVDATTLRSGNFGLVMQELLIGELAECGTNVIDVQLREVPGITCNDGVIALSRNADRLRNGYRAGIVIASSYVVRRNDVLITTRAIDYTNNDVIASAVRVLNRSRSVDDLLGDDRGIKVYERL